MVTTTPYGARAAAHSALSREIDALVSRLRGRSPDRLAGPRGAAALHVVQVLADWALTAEGVPARAVSDAGPAALADQLAVIGADLLASPAGADVLLAAVGEIAWHRTEIDGAGPGRSTVGLLASAWGVDASVDAVLAAARARCGFTPA